MRRMLLFVIGSALSLSAIAQANSQAIMVAAPDPTFQVIVTSRTVQAVNYRHRSGATELALRAQH